MCVCSFTSFWTRFVVYFRYGQRYGLEKKVWREVEDSEKSRGGVVKVSSPCKDCKKGVEALLIGKFKCSSSIN